MHGALDEAVTGEKLDFAHIVLDAVTVQEGGKAHVLVEVVDADLVLVTRPHIALHSGK